MSSITLSHDDPRFGVVVWSGGSFSGPIPPRSGPCREIYDTLIAEGVAPLVEVVTVPVSDDISDRQFFQQLAIEEIISPAEALAAVKTGDIPAALGALLAALPVEARFGAEMLISGATTFRRSHPLSEVIRRALGWTPQRLTDFWRSAADL